MNRALRTRMRELGLGPAPTLVPPSRLAALALAPWFELACALTCLAIGVVA